MVLLFICYVYMHLRFFIVNLKSLFKNKQTPAASTSFFYCLLSLRRKHNFIQCIQVLHAYQKPPSWVRNAAWELFTTRVHVCKQTRTHRRKKHPCSPDSMHEQTAPASATAVVFSADNWSPGMPALSCSVNVTQLFCLSFS